ncbi:LysR family transcriptional regulator [Nonomuraea wenchangensis]
MRIVVIGGTGLIGSRLVGLLTAAGHEAVPRSRSTGVDLLTGRGLPEALEGADVVVDLTKPPAFDDTSPAFFRATMGHLLAAADSAGVGHAVILSIVGADQVPGLAYYRSKVLQEDLLKAGPVPHSIVRSTQFFEFIDTVLSWTSDEHTVRLPPTLLQPVAGDEVARVVAGVSVGTPLRGTLDLAGPEVFPLDELGRITLAARGDRRAVVTDDGAGLYAAAQGRALVAGEGALIAATTYRDWLARQAH